MNNNLGNKKTMAKNIKRLMIEKNVNATEVCNALKIPQSTFNYWLMARTYPRIDKIEMLANYFGVSKPDLIEEPSAVAAEDLDSDTLRMLEELTPEEKQKVDEFVQFLIARRKG